MEPSENTGPTTIAAPKNKPAKSKKKAAAKSQDHLKEFAEATEEKFSEMTDRITKLSMSIGRVAELLEKTIVTSDHKPVRTVETAVPGNVTTIGDVFPSTWRTILDEELGKEFEATILPSSGGDCILQVTSPAHYDTRVGEDRTNGPRDVRCGLVHRASDLSDVRTWAKRFAQNIRQSFPDFNPKRFI